MPINRTCKQILKYLYKNDQGEYLNVLNAFSKKNKPDEKQIKVLLKDMGEFIEYRSELNQEIILTDRNLKSLNDCSNVRISEKGRSYYEEIRSKQKNNLFENIKLVISVLGVIVPLVTLTFTFIIPRFTNVKKDIPIITVKIVNNTDETAVICNRDDFNIFFPTGISNGVPDMAGKYEVLTEKDDRITILPKKEQLLKVKILNNSDYYKYFSSEDCDISFIVHDSNGKVYMSDSLPFNEKNIKKYYTVINIK